MPLEVWDDVLALRSAAPLPRRRGQRAFDRPVIAPQTQAQKAFMQAGASCPFRQGQSDAVVGHQMIASFIHPLLDGCGPAHIAAFVVAVVVNAIQRMSWRRVRADGGQNVLAKYARIMTPILRDANPSASVVGITRFICVGASVDDAFPQSIHGCARKTMGAGIGMIARIASARSRLPERQIAPCHDALCAARALTAPAVVMPRRDRADRDQCRPPTKAIAGLYAGNSHVIAPSLCGSVARAG